MDDVAPYPVSIALIAISRFGLGFLLLLISSSCDQNRHTFVEVSCTTLFDNHCESYELHTPALAVFVLLVKCYNSPYEYSKMNYP